MISTPKPFSPQTLAERWDCSDHQIRRMIEAGKLASFRVGKLIRIPAAEVERIECQPLLPQDTASPGTGENGRSPLIAPVSELRAESRLARITAEKPRLSHVQSGCASTPRKANG